jgi:hypothetical protein
MIRLKQLLQEVHYLINQSDENPFWIIDQNRDVVAHAFGERITGVLAAGNNGFVYELASGKLLKITPDATEVAAVMKLRRLSKMRHMVSYYDVRNITNLYQRMVSKFPAFGSDEPTEYINKKVTNFYAIIMDRVTPLSGEEKETWGNYYYYFLTEDDSIEEFFDEINADRKSMQVKEFWRKLFPQRKQIQRDFKRANINLWEVHQNNVGFDQFGQLVHFDPWINGYGWNKPTINKARLNKSIELPTKFTTDGIDTPNDPTM